MRPILFIAFSFFTLNLFAQQYELTKDSDTLYFSKYEKPIIQKLKLIKPEENKNFFRFSSEKYYLELSEDSNKYLIYANEIWDNKPTGKIFIKQFDLTEKQVNEIKNLIVSLKIHEIPSGNQIKDWAFGFDGITYKFELKDGNKYSHKNYWTPTAQQKFAESNVINFFVIKIDEIIDYKENSTKFSQEVPYFTWTRDGTSWRAMKIINKENYSEYKKYKKLMKKNKSKSAIPSV
ncbi:hypothetical protein [Chryseobacterium rhizosphaerae]|jgi:hypothetical protein|uniref:hypothetical protein n=1 Tax=Chryseobacterium rhizosphaerae TaxID=395937 RepID=UPI002358B542|nr:hypothetical protein [Chryseobacterium rhizosphaerae]MDC8098531.1 hypothetical protein [Chryseobacterium rhizosphaerae]